MFSLSRTRLETFMLCQRRFQLRYVTEVAWPLPPPPASQAAAREAGELFHQLVAQHYLGLETAVVGGERPPEPVRGWWAAFEGHRPRLAGARLFPELTLTVPVGRFLLTGRFDLVATNGSWVRIYDWKTGRPRSRPQLAADWQTRLYLALVVAGGEALGLPGLAPERVEMHYWYADEPAATVKFAYSEEWFREDWREIDQILAHLAERLDGPEGGVWPLTDDRGLCARCAYQTLCGRSAQQGAAVDDLLEGEEGERSAAPDWVDQAGLEPDPA